mgnify:CR=1 FL=1
MNKRLYIIKIIISSLFLIFVGGISVYVVNINPKIQFYDSCLPLSLFLIAISMAYILYSITKLMEEKFKPLRYLLYYAIALYSIGGLCVLGYWIVYNLQSFLM